MGLIIGRYVLYLFTVGGKGFMMDFFVRFTEPAFKITRKIFPFLKERNLPLVSIVLIVLIRISFMIIFKPSK